MEHRYDLCMIRWLIGEDIIRKQVEGHAVKMWTLRELKNHSGVWKHLGPRTFDLIHGVSQVPVIFKELFDHFPFEPSSTDCVIETMLMRNCTGNMPRPWRGHCIPVEVRNCNTD